MKMTLMSDSVSVSVSVVCCC